MTKGQGVPLYSWNKINTVFVWVFWKQYKEKHFIISNLATNNSSAIYELKDLATCDMANDMTLYWSHAKTVMTTSTECLRLTTAGWSCPQLGTAARHQLLSTLTAAAGAALWTDWRHHCAGSQWRSHSKWRAQWATHLHYYYNLLFSTTIFRSLYQSPNRYPASSLKVAFS